MYNLLLEEKEFSNAERERFAKRELPIFTDYQEALQSKVKTSQFSYEDPLEEYSHTIKDENSLKHLKSRTSLEYDTNFRQQERTVDIYRKMAKHPEVEQALTHICDEAMNFSTEPNSEPMQLVMNTDNLIQKGYTEETQLKIRSEYKKILRLFDFKDQGWKLFHQWYVDGKIFFELVFHKGEDEIKQIRLISPYNIMKIKVRRTVGRDTDGYPKYEYSYYYLYDQTPDKASLRKYMSGDYTTNELSDVDVVNYQLNDPEEYDRKPLKIIPEKYVIAVESGLKGTNGFPISQLQFARKYVNELMLLQDAMVVYRLANQNPRMFVYVDMPNYARHHAEQQQIINGIAKQFKQKLIYDQRTGTVLNHRYHPATTEQYYISRFDGQKTAEINFTEGGQHLGKMADVEYFRREVYRALKVPLSRFFEDETLVNLGNDESTARDEMTFSKYIQRLRQQFNKIIWLALQRQLQFKNIIDTVEDFKDLMEECHLKYEGENHYSELKKLQLDQYRWNIFQQLSPTADEGLIPYEYLYKNVLNWTDEEIKSVSDMKERQLDRDLEYETRVYDKKMELARMRADIELTSSPELQVEVAMLEMKNDFTKEKYGDDYKSGGN